jgi:hypothetical protein
MKKVVAGALAVLLFLVLALVVFIATFDWNRARPWIDEKVSAALGRPFAINGNLSVDWRREPAEGGWRAWVPWPHVSAEQLRLGNPAWAKGDHFVSLGKAEFALSPLPLLHKTVSIPWVQLSDADASLQRLADGRANWAFDLGNKDDSGEEKEASPWQLDLGTLGFDRAHIAYDDRQLNASVNLDVTPLGKPIPFSQIIGQDKADQLARQGARAQDYAFAWKAEGRYREQPVSGQGKLGGLLALRDATLPFPLQVDLRAGATRMAVEGTLTDPKHLGALDLHLKLSGDSLGNLYPLIGVTLPDTPPYATDGRLVANLHDPAGASYRYQDFNGHIGDSDIHGQLTYAALQPRPKLSGEFTSNQLLFSDLAPLIGADSNAEKKARGASGTQPPDKALPVEEFRTDRWRQMDADVTFTGKRIVKSDSLPISDLTTHVLLDDGNLKLEPLRFGVAGGTLDSHIALDGRQAPLHGRAQLSARQLKLKQLFPTMQSMQRSLGELNGDANLSGSGNSVAALLGSANGDLRLLMNDGTVSRNLMEIAGLNVGNYLVGRLFGDDEVEINCAVADLGIKDGLAATRLVLIDTENALIAVNGSANFKTEALDFDIVPKSKGMRIVSLRSPLYVHGTFKNPSPGVHATPLVLRGAGLVALGVAVAPVAGVLALIAPSGGQADQCAPLLQQLKAKG